MSGNATCDGKSDDRGSGDNGIFIQFSKFLIFTIFVFLSINYFFLIIFKIFFI